MVEDLTLRTKKSRMAKYNLEKHVVSMSLMKNIIEYHDNTYMFVKQKVYHFPVKHH